MHSLFPRRWPITLSLILLFIPGNASGEEGQPPRPLTDPLLVKSQSLSRPLVPSVEELFAAKDAFGAIWIDDGETILATANLDGPFNLWTLDRAGDRPRSASRSPDRQLNPIALPDRKRIVYETDSGGREMYDLILLDLETGAERNVTASPDTSEIGAVGSYDGRLLAFSSREANASNFDLAVLDIATGKRRTLIAEDAPGYRWAPVEFTPDGKALLANRLNVQQTDGAMILVPLDGSAPHPLGPSGEGVYAIASDLSDEGDRIAFFASSPGENRRSGLLSLDTGAIRWLRSSPWPQSGGWFVPGRPDIAFEENASGRSGIFLYDARRGESESLLLPEGMNRFASSGQSPFTADGATLLFRHQAGHQPNDFWTYSMASKTAAKITELSPAALDGDRLPRTELVHYPSKDGLVISAFVWIPPNLARDGTAPAVVMAHGGPTAQISDFFNRDAVALASRGFVVIAPNFRGSTGYGMDFQLANVGDLGGSDLDDLVAGVNFLLATGYVDRRRVGIMGGSYGGYLTVMGLARHPEVFASGVDLFGILNWQTLLASTEPVLQAYVRNLLGDPVVNAEQYERSSPSTYIDRIEAPLLILQGENDIRTPKSEATALQARLLERGRTVEAVYYPEEGHGFSRRENQMDSLTRVVAWFERTLRER
ncbi:S9 family peptidase [Sphingopyxis sp. YF1]|nr:S9 family peptidase [Sphingopyxis sp. YF1]